LNEVFPERTNSRPHLRAAVAWAQALRLADETAAWSMITPHLQLLEVVPALSLALDELRNRARAARARIEALPGKTAVERHDVCVEGDCFAEWIGRATDIRLQQIARQALRIGADWYIATLGQTSDEPAWILSLWPCRSSAAPRHVQIREMDPAWSLRIITQKQRVVILSDEGSLWLVDLARGTTVRRIHSSLPSFRSAQRADVSIVAFDDEHCVIRSTSEESESETWRIVHVSSGTIRTEFHNPRLHCFRSPQGASLYRANGVFWDKLDVTGQVVEQIELPKNVIPWAVVEVSGTAQPIIIATAIVRSCALAWWQMGPRFFRSFELFDVDDHGQFMEAWFLADRGMFVLTQGKDQRVYWHETTMVKGVLRSGRRRLVNFESCSLVHDPSGKRSWVVRSLNHAPLEVHDAMVWFEKS
jgi:hypothetical protein